MTPGKTEDSAIRNEAYEWLIRLGEAPETTALREELEAWLARSPDHARIWQKTCLMWASMGEAPAFFERPVAAPPLRRAPARRRWMGRAFGGAIAALCLAYVAGPAVWLRMEADARTGTAETRTIALEDGSRVQLGPDSAIASELSAGTRTVRLLAGEIYLDVAHDEARPFHVVSRDLDVRVLGTAFNVRVSDDGTEVGLERGSVNASGAVAGHAVDETLAPGDLVAVDRETGQTRKEKIAPEDIGAWRSQRLIVSNATIGSVIDEIRRYHPSWIVVPDPGFANRRVTGIFNLSDPDKALVALVAPHNGKVRRISSYGRVVTGF